jgi:hypothetical protein
MNNLTNTKNMPKWKKKLSAKDRKHLEDCNTKTLTDFKKNRRHQKENNTSCHECRHMALVLGLEKLSE